MLEFTDTRWSGLQGGFGRSYDPRRALQDLERGANVEAAWSELWQDLYHQGDVGLASYAAVPHLVRVHRLRDVADRNTYALVGAIEQARSSARSPAMPPWLKPGYDEAWRALPAQALRDLARSEDPGLTRAAMGVVAMARGLRRASVPYCEAFPKGTRVRIRSRAALDRFVKEWRLHHRLQTDQLPCAGRAATVKRVSFYHGGDVLYELDGVPGIWHEVCLEADAPE